MMECKAITEGKPCPDLLGSLRVDSDFNNWQYRRDSYINKDDESDSVILGNDFLSYRS